MIIIIIIMMRLSLNYDLVPWCLPTETLMLKEIHRPNWWRLWLLWLMLWLICRY